MCFVVLYLVCFAVLGCCPLGGCVLWFGGLWLLLAGVYLFSVALWWCLLVCTVFWFCTWLGFYVGLDWLFCSVVWAICGGCVLCGYVWLFGCFVCCFVCGFVCTWWSCLVVVGVVCLSLMFVVLLLVFGFVFVGFAVGVLVVFAFCVFGG